MTLPVREYIEEGRSSGKPALKAEEKMKKEE